MPPRLLVEHAQNALMLSLAIVLPVLAVAAIVGLIVAAFQAASQIQDPTIAHLPRLRILRVQDAGNQGEDLIRALRVGG